MIDGQCILVGLAYVLNDFEGNVQKFSKHVFVVQEDKLHFFRRFNDI